jgi:hypothetical protein
MTADAASKLRGRRPLLFFSRGTGSHLQAAGLLALLLLVLSWAAPRVLADKYSVSFTRVTIGSECKLYLPPLPLSLES